MAWAFIVMAIIIGISAYRNRHPDLWKLIKEDMAGSNWNDGFIVWIMAIAVLVALGSIKTIEPITDAFLGLVILVIVLASYRNNKDLFTSFVDQVKRGVS